MKYGAVQWQTLPDMCHGGSKSPGVSMVRLPNMATNSIKQKP